MKGRGSPWVWNRVTMEGVGGVEVVRRRWWDTAISDLMNNLVWKTGKGRYGNEWYPLCC